MNTLTLAGQAEYRTMLAASMDGFVVVNADGQITDCNETFCQMLGRRREELLGTALRELEAKETPEEVARHLSAILQRGHDRFETRLWRKDKVMVDVEFSVALLPSDRKSVVGFAREIGSRKRVEARLLE